MKRPWIPIYVADYLKDTTHLSPSEHGAYFLLILQYWQDGSLPDNERQLARIARMDAREWKDARDVLSCFFSEGWKHKRIDAELAKIEDVSAKRRKAVEAREWRKPALAVVNGGRKDQSND